MARSPYFVRASLLLGGVLGLSGCPQPQPPASPTPAPSAAPSIPPGAAGLVNGAPVPLERVLEALAERVPLATPTPGATPSTQSALERLRALEQEHGAWQLKRAFDRAVYAALADRALAKAGIEVPEKEIETLFERESLEFKVTGDGKRFKSYPDYLNATGSSVAFRKEELRRELGLDRLLGEPNEQLVSEAWRDLEGHFTGRQVQLRHILLKSEAEARAVLKKLEAGASFQSLAASESAEASSAKRGGLVGWIHRLRDVPEPLAALAFRLKPNTPGGPVKTHYGWHLALVDDEKPGKPVTLDAARQKLLPLVRKRRRVEFMQREYERAQITPGW